TATRPEHSRDASARSGGRNRSAADPAAAQVMERRTGGHWDSHPNCGTKGAKESKAVNSVRHRRGFGRSAALPLLVALAAGCAVPPVRVQPASPGLGCQPDGVIPYYLPKPLLVVSKNVENVQNGPKPANKPGDGLVPKVTYTYQILLVPDLSQKYGIKITGRP